MSKMYLALAVLLAVFLSSCASTGSAVIKSVAESNPVEYLKNTPKQEDHPNAAAVVLLSHAYIEVNEDGTELSRETSKYKILSERGYNFGQKSIGYKEGYSEVKVVYANTIRADGTVVPLDPKDIKEFSPYANYDFYTDIKEKRFTMPALEPGCVVEYCIEVKTIKSVYPFDVFVPFKMQDMVPLKEDLLEIVLPEKLELQTAMFLTDVKPEITKTGGKKRYFFKNLDKPEILPETGMPRSYDREVFPQFVAWTLKDWDGIARWYNELVRKQMTMNKELEDFTNNLIKEAGAKTDKEKIRAIFYFVAQKVRYVAVELGPNTHEPHSAVEVFKKRYGDCKDKTTLMLSMMKLIGIEAVPTLVPSNEEAFDEKTPSLGAFNHVIAAVEYPAGSGSYIWLDGTDEVAAFEGVPFWQAARVFVITPDGKGRFVKTPKPADDRDYINYETTMKIDENGDAELTLFTGYYGKMAESRYSYKYTSPDKRKKSIEERGIELESLDIADVANTEIPFTVTIKGKVKGVVQKVDDDTMLLSGVANVEAYEGIVSAKERKYPISFDDGFYSKNKVTYIFPEGFEVKKVPPEFTRDDPYKKSSIKYFSEKNKFQVASDVKNMKYKILPKDFEEFKTYAHKLKKYKTDYSNLVFVRTKKKDDKK
ncbi:MAG: hypothetical protein A2044_05870 [Candidatus Firestonebacteria bacterium GWA2_43_8]|nr:MAG: hypothetical protein A2044_05870 [Candidatus Firestonebacteria bacterium GWA2_43_8]